MGISDYERYIEGLRRRRAPAMERAARLIGEGRFDEADRAVSTADDSIYGAVALAALYRATLEAGRDSEHTAWREGVFERALLWANRSLPPAQTPVEAEQNETARAEYKADLVRLMGSEPRVAPARHPGGSRCCSH